MADVEKVIKQLELLSTHNVAPNIMKEAIQTIGELREDCNRYHECGFHAGYEQGGSDMEKAMQIIIDKLQEQIPKWHLCNDELPTENKYVLVVNKDNWVSTEIYCKATEHTWNSGFYIAWMELPNFEEVE